MTERAYISVDRAEDPRIILVGGPGSGGSNEVTIQDLHDTLNSNNLAAGDPDLDNLDDEFIIDSAGKENLGAGVFVGITSTLQNAQVAFEGNYVAQQMGTVTTADATARVLIDSAATFVTNSVQRGAVVLNWTDRSAGEVTEVISETQLKMRPLQGGIDNRLDLNDEYSIYNVIQKGISGGNLVSVDETNSEISPVFPTFCTQIVRTSSSSATLQEQIDIQYASYNGGVTVDILSPYAGTTFPNGTPRQPVNNLADAVTIANERGFKTLYITGDITLDAAASIEDFVVVGETASRSTIIIEPAANVTNCEFINATITGTLDGGNSIQNCIVENLDFVDGVLEHCVINGYITLSAQDTAHLLDCWSGVPGLSVPTIDMSAAGSPLAIRNYNGGIQLVNKSGPEGVSIDLNSGQVILADTVTTGTIVLRGVGTWTNQDTYAGGATVVNQLLNPRSLVTELNQTQYDGRTYAELQQILLAMAQGRIRENPLGSGVFEFFAQDNSTILYTLTKSGAERNRS